MLLFRLLGMYVFWLEAQGVLDLHHSGMFEPVKRWLCHPVSKPLFGECSGHWSVELFLKIIRVLCESVKTLFVSLNVNPQGGRAATQQLLTWPQWAYLLIQHLIRTSVQSSSPGLLFPGCSHLSTARFDSGFCAEGILIDWVEKNTQK